MSLRIDDTSVPVVILKLYHHCGLGAARTLGRLGVPVYGVHDDPGAAPVRSRYVRETLRWNIDDAPDPESVERIVAFGRRIGGRPILIATDDRSGDFLADNAHALDETFRFPAQPVGLARALADKQTLHELCMEHGVPTPEGVVPSGRDEVLEFLHCATFPVVMKGLDAWRLQRQAGVRMVIVRSAEELLTHYDRMQDPEEPNLLLQEYIPGGPDSVWMLDGYFDADSECRFAVTGQKLRQHPPYTGMTSLGICRINPEVEQLTKEFMRRIGYRGILDLGYRFDARDGLYKLLDVNPRLGATFRLFEGTGDMDVVRALYLDLTGQPIPDSRPRPGRRWMVEDYDVAASIVYRRNGELRLRDWVRSLRGVQSLAWIAVDDPLPSLVMAGRRVRRLARVGQRSRRR